MPSCYPVSRIREAERQALAAGRQLMPLAGAAAARFVAARIAPGTPVLALAGPGNNGGDAPGRGDRAAGDGARRARAAARRPAEAASRCRPRLRRVGGRGRRDAVRAGTGFRARAGHRRPVRHRPEPSPGRRLAGAGGHGQSLGRARAGAGCAQRRGRGHRRSAGTPDPGALDPVLHCPGAGLELPGSGAGAIGERHLDTLDVVMPSEADDV